MNKFQHSAHPVLLIGERCVKRCSIDISPVVTAKVSAQGITLARQSLDESSSAYLCYDRVTSVIEGHTSFSVCVGGGIQARV